MIESLALIAGLCIILYFNEKGDYTKHIIGHQPQTGTIEPPTKNLPSIGSKGKINLIEQYDDQEDKRVLEEFFKVGLIDKPSKHDLDSKIASIRELSKETGKSYAVLMREKTFKTGGKDIYEAAFEKAMDLVEHFSSKDRTCCLFNLSEAGISGYPQREKFEKMIKEQGFRTELKCDSVWDEHLVIDWS